MTLLKKDTFVCIDCETTGLDTTGDRIIEVAGATFTFDNIIDRFETLIDPQMLIPAESMEIHHITDEMVQGKPLVQEVLPTLFELVKDHIIVGHGITFDIEIIINTAKRLGMPCSLDKNRVIDTLRLARLYGESPSNALEFLRKHFNIAEEGAHRAMSDVIVNIEVFKKLSGKFKTTQQLIERLQRPIAMKHMPLGKHKGRLFKEIPVEYLRWAANKDFDQDLLYSIRSELKNRKGGNQFCQASNPFQSL